MDTLHLDDPMVYFGSEALLLLSIFSFFQQELLYTSLFFNNDKGPRFDNIVCHCMASVWRCAFFQC